MVEEGVCGSPSLRQDCSHSNDYLQDCVCVCECVCTIGMHHRQTLRRVEKDRFYQMLQCTVATILASEQLIACGDWNGHIGSQSKGFE